MIFTVITYGLYLFSGFLPVLSSIKSIEFGKAHEFLKAIRMSSVNSSPFFSFLFNNKTNYFKMSQPVFVWMMFWRAVGTD